MPFQQATSELLATAPSFSTIQASPFSLTQSVSKIYVRNYRQTTRQSPHQLLPVLSQKMFPQRPPFNEALIPQLPQVSNKLGSKQIWISVCPSARIGRATETNRGLLAGLTSVLLHMPGVSSMWRS